MVTVLVIIIVANTNQLFPITLTGISSTPHTQIQILPLRSAYFTTVTFTCSIDRPT